MRNCVYSSNNNPTYLPNTYTSSVVVYLCIQMPTPALMYSGSYLTYMGVCSAVQSLTYVWRHLLLLTPLRWQSVRESLEPGVRVGKAGIQQQSPHTILPYLTLLTQIQRCIRLRGGKERASGGYVETGAGSKGRGGRFKQTIVDSSG